MTGELTVVERQSWFALALLTLVQTLNMADRNILNIVIEPIKYEFALSDAQIGLLSGLVFGSVNALASIPMGLMADRFNRSWLLGMALFAWSGATVLAAGAQAFVGLLLVRLMVAATEAAGGPTSMALISDYFPPNRRPTAISIYFLGIPLGSGLSLLLGGYMVAHYGWRAGFLTAGVPGLVVALLVVCLLREPRQSRRPAKSLREGVAELGLWEALMSMWRSPTTRALCAGSACFTGAFSAASAWAAPFMMRQHGVAVDKAGAVIGITMALGGFGLIGSGVISERIRDRDPRYGLLFSAGVAVATGGGTALFLLSPGFVGVVTGLAVIGLVGACYIGPIYGAVLNLAPEGRRGAVIAILQVLTNLFGFGFGSLGVGVLSDLIGGPQSLRFALMSVLVVYAVAAALFIYASRRINAELGVQT